MYKCRLTRVGNSAKNFSHLDGGTFSGGCLFISPGILKELYHLESSCRPDVDERLEVLLPKLGLFWLNKPKKEPVDSDFCIPPFDDALLAR